MQQSQGDEAGRSNNLGFDDNDGVDTQASYQKTQNATEKVLGGKAQTNSVQKAKAPHPDQLTADEVDYDSILKLNIEAVKKIDNSVNMEDQCHQSFSDDGT